MRCGVVGQSVYDQNIADRTDRAIDQFCGHLPEMQYLPVGVVCRWWVDVITGIGGDILLTAATMTMVTRRSSSLPVPTC